MSEIYPIAVPKWGIEMVEGTITTWNKSEGDTVAKGDEVFEMESDKIVNVWDSPVAGVLRVSLRRPVMRTRWVHCWASLPPPT